MIKTVKKSILTTLVVAVCLSSYAQSSKKSVSNGWHLKDNYGISIDKAYQFVKGKKSQTVVVAVIDSGIDTTHEDLKPILWTNPKEVPGNGIDDDGNGYVDDVHGWNFLGGRDGRNVKEDSYEAARFYHSYKEKFEKVTEPSSLSKADREVYQSWLRAKAAVVQGVDPTELLFIRKLYPLMKRGDSIIAKDLGKAEYAGKEIKSYVSTDKDAMATKNIILS